MTKYIIFLIAPHRLLLLN